MSRSKRIFKLFQPDQAPDHVFRQFQCDLVEKVLGPELTPVQQEALEVLQVFTKGGCDFSEVEKVRSRAFSDAMTPECVYAAGLFVDTLREVRSWLVTMDGMFEGLFEKGWQLRHLKKLIEEDKNGKV